MINIDDDSMFVLGITTKRDTTGKFDGFQVISKNVGVPDEAVITMVRMWFREKQDNYYKKYKAG